ncbi:LysM peptidoglycan-binding domain-containing protein [Cerina litoralis]|nr:LysM peptidoglycan-binding domain-containing protein [Cerina litoralis]
MIAVPLAAQQTLTNVKNDTLQPPPSEITSDTIALTVADMEQMELQEKPTQLNDGEVSYARILSKYNLKDSPEAAKYDSLWLKQLHANASLYDSIYKDVSQLEIDTTYHYSLDTDTLKSRLAKLDQRTPFNISYNPSLENVIKMFLTRKRDFIERMLVSSQFYFPMFEQELDNYNIPLEIKYLAIIESALNPRAKSRVGATGLWQFMYGTGRMLDLGVSSYVDERSDPIKSTKAACQYLSQLYNIFEDWDLVLAAYNSGPGNVNKAIRRSGGRTNYWNIRRNLPRETAGYVPAFLAVMYIFEYAKEHDLAIGKVERPFFETDTVKIKKMITFDQISELVGVDKEELEVLNPSYKLDIIPYVDGKNYTLRLPVSAIGKFVNNEDAIYAQVEQQIEAEEKPLPQLVTAQDRIRYRVRSGDYLGKIAERYGVGVSQIKRWNGLRSNNLRIGQRLTIYPRKPVTSKATASKPSNTASKTAIPDGTKIHTVQQGDSLWTISRKYPGITVDNLKEWNGIKGSNLQPGTVLKLCDCSS